ncbi:unnamed protein product [Soboliphyme baturini]|uniref:C2H2-type domain-containing protein n=1 Tax=Soboliphyme baturini TaxID=241478 RepID=A0A183IZ40_9BILA|nr:unnamed protein product [Soboliphyme baturini]
MSVKLPATTVPRFASLSSAADRFQPAKFYRFRLRISEDRIYDGLQSPLPSVSAELIAFDSSHFFELSYAIFPSRLWPHKRNTGYLRMTEFKSQITQSLDTVFIDTIRAAVASTLRRSSPEPWLLVISITSLSEFITRQTCLLDCYTIRCKRDIAIYQHVRRLHLGLRNCLRQPLAEASEAIYWITASNGRQESEPLAKTEFHCAFGGIGVARFEYLITVVDIRFSQRD